ncbi:hypothetical protein BJL90_02340 [Clostridium formicaceticum]|nr:hypothetical protein BJL90_02340 [Clostridium formicaceticum]
MEGIENRLKEFFYNNEGLVIRPFKIKTYRNHKAFIAYIDGLVHMNSIEINVLKPLMKEDITQQLHYITSKTIADTLIAQVITSVNSFTVKMLDEAVFQLLKGSAIVFIEDSPTAIVVPSQNWETRSVAEPSAEAVVRGPREGFNEDLYTNITLIRRKVKNTKLKFEFITRGIYSNTELAICYIEGLADEKILKELKERIERMNIDAVLESGYIEEFIEDQPLSPFPTIGNTEKPDVVVGKILEGRIAILCDGTPFALTIPHLFIEHLQTGEDYYTRWTYASILRILRFFALFITTTLPAVYVAVQTFHQEIIPFKLFLSVASARDGIPFSSFTEAVMMIIIFELIKEAGIRMPKPVGEAISIVGAIVLGQATVEAGIASPLMVIVVALTAIAGFVVPALDEAILLSRVLLLVFASIVGFYGIVFGITMIFIYLCNLRSFGMEYLYALTPTYYKNFQDAYIRAPLWSIFIKKNAK